MSFGIAIEGIRKAVGENPAAAAALFTADHDLVGTTEVEVRIGDHLLRIDEPESLGGTALGPNPVEIALASLGSCQAITYRVWATLRGVRVDRVKVRVEGDLDVRGFFGLDEGVRPGFGGVRVVVTVSGPESEEVYRSLQDEADRYCPVLDIFRNPVPVTTRLEVEALKEVLVEAPLA